MFVIVRPVLKFERLTIKLFQKKEGEREKSILQGTW